MVNKENDGLFTRIARFIKYHTRLVLIVLFFTGITSLAVFGNKGILQRLELESERKNLEEQLNAEIKKAQQLQKEIEELKSNDKKIEKVAREKYGMTKEGEKIYKVTTDSTK